MLAQPPATANADAASIAAIKFCFMLGSVGSKECKELLIERVDRHAEDIAGAALGLDVLRLRRVQFDLAPQPQNLHVDGAIVDLGAIPPREIEQLLAREHPLRRCAKRLQQVELAVAELDAATLGRSEPAAAEVELPAGEAVGAPLVAARQQQLARGLMAAQHCADAGEELARAEGLGDVVVGAELESHHPVGFVLLAGDDDDRGRALLPELARKLHAVLSRKAQVEHDQVDGVLGQRLRHLRPGPAGEKSIGEAFIWYWQSAASGSPALPRVPPACA